MYNCIDKCGIDCRFYVLIWLFFRIDFNVGMVGCAVHFTVNDYKSRFENVDPTRKKEFKMRCIFQETALEFDEDRSKLLNTFNEF